MNMKTWFILFVLAGGVYWYIKTPAAIDVLMQPVGSDVNTEYTGIRILADEGGAGFDVNDLTEPGLTTVVEFYTESCPGCKLLGQHYKRFLNVRSDVAVRRVRMPGRWNPGWAKDQFGLSIGSTPHILIFDREGRPVAMDEGLNKQGYKYLYKWMNAELKKQWDRERT